MKVDDADFEFLEEPPVPDWVMRVKVTGENFQTRAVPLGARVDEEEVEGILIDLDGNGFTGYLRSEPPNGASLFVGYLDGDLFDTGIEYEAPIA